MKKKNNYYYLKLLNTSRYRIIATGKVQKAWIKDAISIYKKRLPGISIIEIRDSSPEKETKTIEGLIKPGEKIIALSEEGERVTSIALAKRLESLGSQRLVFILGGPEGLTKNIKSLAFWKLSLSPMTFPHEIARLIVLEQIYRAQTICKGIPYHREGSTTC